MKRRLLLFTGVLSITAVLMTGCGSNTAQTQVPTADSAVQTESSAAQTESSAAQTESSAAQTESSAAQTESSAAQTESSAAQTESSAAQTESSADLGFLEKDAKEAALRDVGVNEKEALAVSVKKDYDDGYKVYDVDVYTTDKDYEYTISADDGTILKKEAEVVPKMTSDSGNVKIKLEDVKKIVFAEVPGAEDRNLRLALEKDSGRWVYEGEIIYDNNDYDFEIDAESGAITEWSRQSL